MAENTEIAWATHTFNPWRGCVEVSEGCENCYAREWAKRNPAVLGRWGLPAAGGTRQIASDAQWREPMRWNRRALESGVPERVFCASLADVFEDLPELFDPRARLWTLIRATPALRWLLLTKRPQNIRRFLPGDFIGRTNWEPPSAFRHVWFGATVENQERAYERIPQLLMVPARLRFLSCEPLLGPIDLAPWLHLNPDRGIGWVIVGGESRQGGQCREMQMEWMEGIVSQCQAAKVPVFVKQLGTEPRDGLHKLELRKKDTHGRDLESIPDWLRIREVPNV